MLLFALSLLFGYGNAAACTAGAAGANCDLVNLGTTADPITQVNILDITVHEGNACANQLHQWQIYMTGTPSTTTTSAIAFGASGTTHVQLHSANTDCISIGSSLSSGGVWQLNENEKTDNTCPAMAGLAATAIASATTCFTLDVAGAHTDGKAWFTQSIKAGTAAKLPGKLYQDAADGVVSGTDDSDIFGTAGASTNTNAITLIVWKSLADATCLNANGTSATTAFTKSYKIFCNAQVTTIQFYTAKDCVDADKVTLAATHKFFTGTTTLAGQAIEIAEGGSNMLGGTAGVNFVADGSTDPCVKLNPPASGSPASALNTAAAAAVLAAGALIL